MSEAPAAAPAAAEVAAPETFKVFAGNLAFATTDDALKQFFTGVGEVVDAHVVTRGNHSVGYGFVDYATLELAEKAVQELDKQQLDGRTINVELARAREEGAPRAEGASRGGRRRGRGRGRGRGGFRGPPGGAPPAGGAALYQPQQQQQSGGAFRGGFRGYNYPAGAYDAAYYGYEGGLYYPPYQGPARGGRAPRPGRRARQQEEGEEEQPAEHQQRGEEAADHEGGEGEQRGGRRRGRGGFRRGGRGGRGARPSAEGAAPAGDFQPAGAAPEGEFRGRRRGGRGGRRFQGERRPRDENQEPSETTLFIANLPYDMNEEGLIAVFKDYQPKQARIARARGRSKGFGFVQLETHELQQKAAAEIDNSEVQGRVLNVKPALVDLSEAQPEAQEEAPKEEAKPSQQ